ncbi:uncharacterized protein TrAtP1_001071 [Trichoderma atroviride]|uniref:uncharacterized protein n=1 Tax=Hypocrea atroviridis TaxID=63577 RepID=UPI00332FE075|nr:hypothetical protein TrAtP1_001071 [Trichoderma atroviride]
MGQAMQLIGRAPRGLAALRPANSPMPADEPPQMIATLPITPALDTRPKQLVQGPSFSTAARRYRYRDGREALLRVLPPPSIHAAANKLKMTQPCWKPSVDSAHKGVALPVLCASSSFELQLAI